MAQLVPYLTCNGNCRQVMEFYKSCLGGQLEIMTAGESPMAGRMPKELHEKVMHSVLKKDAFILYASDMMEPGALTQGNTITLTLTCPTREDAERYFRSLSAGGKIGHDLSEQFFGTIGDFIDKFGFGWMCVSIKPR